MYRIFARFRGRTKRRKSSASSMKEDLRDFSLHALFRPIRVLAPDPCDLHLASGPVKLFRQTQAFLARDRTQYGDLFGAWLFVGEHGNSVVENSGSSKASSGGVERSAPGNFLLHCRAS